MIYVTTKMQQAKRMAPKNSYHHIFHQSPSSILAYLAFLVSCTIIAVLCELNRYPWNQNTVLQNITTASFCVFAAALYVTYMFINASLRLVLSYVENAYAHSSYYYHDERMMKHENYDEEDDEEDDDEDEEMNRVLLKHNNHRASLDEHINQRNKVQNKNENKEGKALHVANSTEEGETVTEIPLGNNNTGSSDGNKYDVTEENDLLYAQRKTKSKRSPFTRFFMNDMGMYYPFHRSTENTRDEVDDNDGLPSISENDEEGGKSEEMNGGSRGGNRRMKNLFLDISKYFHDRKRRNAALQSNNSSNLKRRLPRSVIISSMYLGGSGAYLAIAPLCMWDFTMSASFIAALLFISCIDTQKIDCDFKPDVDTAGAIRRLKWMRRSFHFCAFVSILLILGLDTQEEIEYYIVPIFSTHLSLVPQNSGVVYPVIQQLNPPLLSNPDFKNRNDSFTQTETVSTQIMPGSYTGPTTMMASSNNNNNAVVLEGHTGLAYKWPLIILSASSPMFLRAGGGGVSNFYFSLPPSQTLETGLPVSTILAILVLCWHNPNEQIIHDIQGMINLKTAIPMFVICPMCVAAALAFILYGFKKRSSGIIAVVLLLILCIRQQISSPHHLKSHLDWITLGNTANTVILVVSYLLYRKNVLLPPHQRHTWNKKPVVILVDSKEENEDNQVDNSNDKNNNSSHYDMTNRSNTMPS